MYVLKSIRQGRSIDISPTGYMNSFYAMWGDRSVCYLGFDFSSNPLPGWTLGTTFVTGQPRVIRITHTTHTTCPPLSQQVTPTALNPDNQLSLSPCTVRLHRTFHRANLSTTCPVLSLLSKLKNRYATCIHSRLQIDTQFYTQGWFWSVVRYCFSRHLTICRWECRIKSSN